MITFTYSDLYTTVNCNLIEKRELRRLLSARPDGYMFAPKFKRGMWDGYISLLDRSNQFPSGLLEYVLENLDETGCDYDVLGYELSNFKPDTYGIPNYTFRPYQVDAINAVLKHQRGVLKMATNAGKTLVAAGIIKATGNKAVVIVPNQALLLQTADELESMLEISVGRYGAGYSKHEDVTVTTMASLSKLVKKDLSKNVTLIADECFVAGTLIDGKPIETVQIGDYVTAYNECTKTLDQCRVLNVYKQKAPKQLVIMNAGCNQIITTCNHPIMTYDGWKQAIELGVDDYVLCCNVCRMWKCNYQSHKTPTKMHQVWVQSVLQVGMQNTISIEIELKNYAHYQPEIQFTEIPLKTNEGKQSIIKSCITNEDGCNSQIEWELETDNSRGQWETNTDTAKVIGRSSGLGCGSCHQNWDEKGLSPLLQSGHRQQAINDSHRSGWEHSQWASSPCQRPQENRFLDWVGVDSVEILEQGSDGRFEQMCPDGYVYNLEVEGLHTYTANNVVVHNCQHARSDQVFTHIFSIPGQFRIGMSGTPLTYQRLSDLKLVGATGNIIYEISNTQLIEEGYSSKPIIKFVKIAEPKVDTKKNYQLAYDLGIVNNELRNRTIAEIAQRERTRGPVLVICNWVEHVNNIASFDRSFITATGQTSRFELERILESFNDSDDVLVVSPIFGEGVNIPSVATVILASGNKSHIQLLQRIGRGLRKTADKNVVHIYDFIDATNKYLLKHSEERHKLYKAEGFSLELLK